MNRGVVVVVGAVLLAGCAPTPKRTYEIQKEIMIGSPAAYRYQVARCVQQFNGAPFRSSRLIAIAQAPADRGTVVVCERIMAAVRDGRLTYEHYLNLFNENDTPEVVSVLRGS